jgi:hypothetical protein
MGGIAKAVRAERLIHQGMDYPAAAGTRKQPADKQNYRCPLDHLDILSG